MHITDSSFSYKKTSLDLNFSSITRCLNRGIFHLSGTVQTWFYSELNNMP